MRSVSWPRLGFFALILGISGCAPEPYWRPSDRTPTPTSGEQPAEEPAEIGPETEHGRLALLYRAHPKEDANRLADFFSAHPDFHATLVFPTGFFVEEERKDLIHRFRVLQSSGQIEIALTLDNEPILPLLGNAQLAAGPSKNWDVSFSWPEDIANQIARGSGRYQKKWHRLPAGFFPPYRALSKDVVEGLKRFRLTWALGPTAPEWGCRFYGALAVWTPPELPAIEDPELVASWTLDQPIVFVDAERWASFDDGVRYLAFLEEANAARVAPARFITLEQMTSELDTDVRLPASADPFAVDYSLWSKSPQQRQAWNALADARRQLERYKNSGQANLKKLDAATEEMAAAESGPFLLALGQSEVPIPMNEQNFLATLANVYRLSGVSPPEYLSGLFSNRRWQKFQPAAQPGGRPFFLEESDRLTWSDPADDDNGSGSYVYPQGRYPKGLFDLTEFFVAWTESDITVSASFAAMAGLNDTVLLPTVDVYIDINRLLSAGSATPLKKRSPAVVQKSAAWEYAIEMNPATGNLYQSLPGEGERKTRSFLPQVDFGAKSITVVIPRSVLRGDPRSWRLSVGVLGSDTRRPEADIQPAPVLANPGQKNFGGAVSGRQAPPYIDLLAETGEEQINILRGYESGGQVSLPYVEAP